METRSNLIRIVSEEEYHVQDWYPWIKDHTFETIFLPLTLGEAKLLVRHTKLSVKDNNFKFCRKFICNKETEHTIREGVANIEKKIDEEIEKMGGNKAGVFVRLSSRSPKDSVQDNLFNLYLQEKASLLNEGHKDAIASKIAYTRANVRCLRVHSAAEALLLMLNSNRVNEDLQMMVKLATLKDDEILTQIVIRKWEPILPEFEFRAFIFGRKLTGVTQYYKSTYVPLMAQLKEKLEERITLFYNETQHLIPERINDYVVDYALDPFSDKIWIVEINTPPPVAGQALFDWDNEEDKKIIIGQSPFEFRIIEKEPSNPMEDIQYFIDGEIKKRKTKTVTRKLSV